MPVRSEKVIDGRIWECKMDDKGEIKLSQRSDDTLSCDGHPYGSEWEEDWRKYRCGEGGMKEFMGCIESSGIFIANGEVKSVDGSYIECKKHEDGSVTMQGVEKLNRVMCRDIEGREREEGFEWKEGPLQYRCGRKGVKEFMGCITPSGIFIASGGVVSVDGFDLECKKLANGTIRMRLLQRSKIKCKDREGREWEEGIS
uniref:SRCR domain-containing protein n=1 Tax=Angiostrongylus cantonensis TaxID=6313 RepID=A0A0K0D2M2_ANGCA